MKCYRTFFDLIKSCKAFDSSFPSLFNQSRFEFEIMIVFAVIH